MAASLYVLDSGAFIDARRRWYSFKVCPGYWKALNHHMAAGTICSIDRVRDELSDSELQDWIVRADLSSAFKTTDSDEVLASYSNVMTKVLSSGFYLPSAKAVFAQAERADAWLIAYALAHGATIVTQERPHPTGIGAVKIPDVCNDLNIPWMDSFTMLEELGIQFTWSAPYASDGELTDAPMVMERMYIGDGDGR